MTKQQLFQHHICSGNRNDASGIKTMKFQLTGDHLGRHFCIGSCAGSAAASKKPQQFMSVSLNSCDELFESHKTDFLSIFAQKSYLLQFPTSDTKIIEFWKQKKAKNGRRHLENSSDLWWKISHWFSEWNKNVARNPKELHFFFLQIRFETVWSILLLQISWKSCLNFFKCKKQIYSKTFKNKSVFHTQNNSNLFFTNSNSKNWPPSSFLSDFQKKCNFLEFRDNFFLRIDF